MELRHLRYFIAVAEELHFGRAAARLHISQPPLSQQIMDLEEELGVKLFERTRRKVALTEAGRMFLDEARAVLDRANDAVALVRRAGQGEVGRLTVGFVTSASYSVLPCAVRLFRKAHPEVELHVREMKPAEQITALERKDIDLGLLRPPVSCPQTAMNLLLEEPLVAAIPMEHPLAMKKRIRFASLKGQPLVLFPRRHGPGLYDVILQSCVEAGFTPVATHEPDDMQSVLAHVAGGLGIAIVPGSLSVFHQKEIAYRPMQEPRGCLALAALYRIPVTSPLITSFLAKAGIAAKRWTTTQ